MDDPHYKIVIERKITVSGRGPEHNLFTSIPHRGCGITTINCASHTAIRL